MRFPRFAVIVLVFFFLTCYFGTGFVFAEEGSGEYETDLPKGEQSISLFSPYPSSLAVCPAVPESLNYTFSVPGTLQEAGNMGLSTSPYFWLNSGAKLLLEKGIGRTILGNLPTTDKWAKLYKASNPRDTDNGLHPQNLLRLITKTKWKNFTEQFNFKISKINLSASPERNAWSGVFNMLRYKDGQNLYYAGVRMDGRVVIKKKVRGVYYTMAERQFYAGTYNRVTKPNLIPINKWIGLKVETLTLTDGVVMIRLFIAPNGDNKWKFVLEARDGGTKYGGAPHDYYGFAGIRTDYMDVSFDNLKLSSYR